MQEQDLPKITTPFFSELITFFKEISSANHTRMMSLPSGLKSIRSYFLPKFANFEWYTPLRIPSKVHEVILRETVDDHFIGQNISIDN